VEERNLEKKKKKKPGSICLTVSKKKGRAGGKSAGKKGARKADADGDAASEDVPEEEETGLDLHDQAPSNDLIDLLPSESSLRGTERNRQSSPPELLAP